MNLNLGSILVGSEMVSLVCWQIKISIDQYFCCCLLYTLVLRHQSAHGCVGNSLLLEADMVKIDFRVYLGLAHGTARSGPSRPGWGGEWLAHVN